MTILMEHFPGCCAFSINLCFLDFAVLVHFGHPLGINMLHTFLYYSIWLFDLITTA